ncbi:uncharacterized protein [Primulina eburnea]|uniref:uncharacterized protein isoform X2 n=1 Tax=Primulina eburnea TaxID=1245227 RepID=UPI003C6C5995
MIFRKGDNVEVMSKKEGPVSWRFAEVLSCKGHSVCLRYDLFPGGEKELMVETVSREFVRPDPPLVQGLENCISGDIVEVFYQCSWNIAAIVKYMGSKRENMSNKIYRPAASFQNKYLVRIIGSSKELIIDQSNIRLRQTWHHGKWVLIGMNSQMCEDTKASKPSTSNCYQKMNFQVPLSNACPTTQKDFVRNDVGVRKSPAFSASSLKRISPNDDLMAEAYNGPFCKFRAVEKDGRVQRTTAALILGKGHCWRHDHLLQKGLKIIPGFATVLLAYRIGRYVICFQTDASIFGYSLIRRTKEANDMCLIWERYLLLVSHFRMVFEQYSKACFAGRSEHLTYIVDNSSSSWKLHR